MKEVNKELLRLAQRFRLIDQTMSFFLQVYILSFLNKEGKWIRKNQ